MKTAFFSILFVATAHGETGGQVVAACPAVMAEVEKVVKGLTSPQENFSKDGQAWLTRNLEHNCQPNCSQAQLRMLANVSEPVGPGRRPQSPVGTLESEDLRPRDLGEMTPEAQAAKRRAIRAQNEAINVLGQNGYYVAVNPTSAGSPEIVAKYLQMARNDGIAKRHPDILLGSNLQDARIFDVFSPTREGAWRVLFSLDKKADPHNRQARRFVVHFAEDNESVMSNALNLDALRGQLRARFEHELKRGTGGHHIDQVVAVVTKAGKSEIVNVFP